MSRHFRVGQRATAAFNGHIETQETPETRATLKRARKKKRSLALTFHP